MICSSKMIAPLSFETMSSEVCWWLLLNATLFTLYFHIVVFIEYVQHRCILVSMYIWQDSLKDIRWRTDVRCTVIEVKSEARVGWFGQLKRESEYQKDAEVRTAREIYGCSERKVTRRGCRRRLWRRQLVCCGESQSKRQKWDNFFRRKRKIYFYCHCTLKVQQHLETRWRILLLILWWAATVGQPNLDGTRTRNQKKPHRESTTTKKGLL